MSEEMERRRRIDVLGIGLFGLAVGALTLGVAQLGTIPDSGKVGTLVIAITFSSTVLARLDGISETLPGLLHIVVGLMAFCHAVAGLTQAFTGHQLAPLGPPLLHHRTGSASRS